MEDLLACSLYSNTAADTDVSDSSNRLLILLVRVLLKYNVCDVSRILSRIENVIEIYLKTAIILFFKQQ